MVWGSTGNAGPFQGNLLPLGNPWSYAMVASHLQEPWWVAPTGPGFPALLSIFETMTMREEPATEQGMWVKAHMEFPYFSLGHFLIILVIFGSWSKSPSLARFRLLPAKSLPFVISKLIPSLPTLYIAEKRITTNETLLNHTMCPRRSLCFSISLWVSFRQPHASLMLTSKINILRKQYSETCLLSG